MAAPGRPTGGGGAANRLLLPKEHGAYGQLACPLAAALLGGRPTWTAALIALGAVAAFVAHEPLLVLLGQRGTRARREDGRRAVAWLLGVGGLAAGAGVAGLWLGPPEARLAAALPAVLGALVLLATWRKSEKTAPGEVLAAAALAGCALPVAIAAGLAPQRAASAWVVWSVGLTAATLAVRRVIGRHRGRDVPSAVALVLLLAAGTGAAAILVDPGLAAAGPMLLAATVLVFLRLHPRHLRRVGWTLVGSSVVTIGLLVWVARALP